MKKDYVIMSDNMGDLPQSYYEEHQIPIMYLSYTMEGETFDETHRQSNEAFYRCMREGALPTTSQSERTLSQAAAIRKRCPVSVVFFRFERHL